MIKIPKITDGEKAKIEKKHLEFFLKYCLEEFKEAIPKSEYIDNILKEESLKKNEDFEIIHNYFSKIKNNEDVKFLEEDVIKKIIFLSYNEFKILKEILPKKNEKKEEKEGKKDEFKIMMEHLYKEKFRNGRSKGLSSKWGAVQLIEDLGLKVCPYCNRNYLIQYKENTTAQIDHFYDKSTYPILALSLYNLIPSCTTCNHLKGTKDGILYPYETGFDDKGVIFEVDSEQIAFKIKPEEENFNIILKNKEKYKEIEKAIDEVFYLEEMYKEHKSDVVDIFYKSRIFNKKHIEGLVKMLEPGSEKEIKDIIESYEGNPNNYHKKPLSKLNYDIRNQIKNTNSQKT